MKLKPLSDRVVIKALEAEETTKAAVEEGIVPGGGTAFANILPNVAKLLDETEGDEKTGVAIVVKALEEPIRQIAFNAGKDGSVILDNAASVASMILTTEALVADKPEPPAAAPAAPAPGMY